ncbi:MAG: hypothetical protein V7603_3383 [Micromonosporaceae bacterium]
MGALPVPGVPDGPVRVLFQALHELHHRAGWPSLRNMASEVGCSHTTVSVAFSTPRVPRWGMLELIVETLDGDVDRFRHLWLAATAAGGPAGDIGASEPDRAIAGPVPMPPQPGPPRQLPPDVAAFAGRTRQLAELDRLVRAPRATVVISAVSGTAGVGKTALAVHWAHRVADRFPDGQFYVDLRGYDADRPVPAGEALEMFLRALGVDGSAIAQQLAERAAQYRTLMAGRSMLVLLDNAYCVDQVRDLLPGTGSCLVLVTSRAMLPALVARHGAIRLNLDVLPVAEAVALLRMLIGARVDVEPVHALALAHQCARLPLALRIAAELAAARPDARLAHLVADLADESRRLDLLAAGEDDHTAVRTVFSWSCRHLAPDADRAFRLLGLPPGRDVDGHATAALLDTDVSTAGRLLDTLSRAHLVHERSPGRFAMHDLLRAYAAEQAGGAEGLDPLGALARLFDYYATAAAAAAGLAFPYHPPPTRVHHGPTTPSFTSAGQARAWLDTERPNLLAVAHRSATEGWAHASRLSVALAMYLEVRARYADALALHGLAHRAARDNCARAEEATALDLLGTVHLRVGQYSDAFAHYERSLAIAREIGDRAAQGAAMHGLGTVQWRLGRLCEARDLLARALAIHRAIGDRHGEGAALYGLGSVHRQSGRYLDALDHHRQALTIHQEIGDSVGESRALNNLGTTLERMGRLAEAVEHHQRSLAICEEIGNRLGESVALINLGFVKTRLGRFDEALEHHQHALDIQCAIGRRVGQGYATHGLGVLDHRLGRHDKALGQLTAAAAIGGETGEVDMQTAALIDLADTLRAIGRCDEALIRYQSALTLAERTGDRYEQARALCGLGHLRRDAGDRAGARHHWRLALSNFEDLDVPEASEVRASLTALGPAPHRRRTHASAVR